MQKFTIKVALDPYRCRIQRSCLWRRSAPFRPSENSKNIKRFARKLHAYIIHFRVRHVKSNVRFGQIESMLHIRQPNHQRRMMLVRTRARTRWRRAGARTATVFSIQIGKTSGFRVIRCRREFVFRFVKLPPGNDGAFAKSHFLKTKNIEKTYIFKCFTCFLFFGLRIFAMIIPASTVCTNTPTTNWTHRTIKAGGQISVMYLNIVEYNIEIIYFV